MQKDSKITSKDLKPDTQKAAPGGKGSSRKKKKPKKAHNRNKNTRIRERAFAAATQIPNESPLPTIPKDDNFEIQRGLYSDEILPKVEKLASQGLNNAQIAEALCIGNKTFYDWRNRYPQFLHALKKYRGVADIMVENALFRNAIGFNFTEVKRERRFNKETKQYEIVITEELTKHIPGNATAQIFYLKNRMPERYKDKVEMTHSLGAGMAGMVFALKRREE